jgi:hypothetical protein
MLDEGWIETTTDINTVNWKGDAIHLTGVRAFRSTKGENIVVYPYDVAQAEIRQIAGKHGLIPRDVALFLIWYAKPGNFEGGEVLYKYHLNKMLFYQWKELEKQNFKETLPHDEFISARNGPVPKNINEDLDRLEKMGVVRSQYKKWGEGETQRSRRTMLTDEGLKIAMQLWNEVPEPFKKVSLKVKEQLFALDPATVRKKVHREYPEYRKTYLEPDME